MPALNRIGTQSLGKALLVAWGCVLLPALLGCRPVDGNVEASAAPVELTVFAAASLTDALRAVRLAFEQTQSRPVEFVFNFAGSGALAQQLLAAPRADVFISADEQWMLAMAFSERLDADSVTVFLSNTLCVVAHPDSTAAVTGPADLCALDFKHLALGDPAFVPAGRYAKDWLQGVNCDGTNLWSKLEARLVPAPDVRAVLGQVAATRDMIGIVYESDHRADPDRVRKLFSVPRNEGPQIRYVAAALQTSRQAALAAEFIAFLRSPTAGEIFTAHGFSAIAQAAE